MSSDENAVETPTVFGGVLKRGPRRVTFRWNCTSGLVTVSDQVCSGTLLSPAGAAVGAVVVVAKAADF